MTSGIKKAIVWVIPDIIWDYYRLVKHRGKRRSSHTVKSVSDTFRQIHDSNAWNSDESVSGTGSDLIQTEAIRNYLPALLQAHQVNTILDIPCGDFNWMKLVDLKGIQYLGADIVDKLIEDVKARYANTEVSFIRLNLLEDKLPRVDLVLCRDCLVHFSYAHIAEAIRCIKTSGSKYLLTTSFTQRRLNFDIATGDWRPINLSRKPFNFPTPVEVIMEKCTEGNGKSYDKALVLYKVSDLPDLLPLLK